MSLGKVEAEWVRIEPNIGDIDMISADASNGAVAVGLDVRDLGEISLEADGTCDPTPISSIIEWWEEKLQSERAHTAFLLTQRHEQLLGDWHDFLKQVQAGNRCRWQARSATSLSLARRADSRNTNGSQSKSALQARSASSLSLALRADSRNTEKNCSKTSTHDPLPSDALVPMSLDLDECLPDGVCFEQLHTQQDHLQAKDLSRRSPPALCPNLQTVYEMLQEVKEESIGKNGRNVQRVNADPSDTLLALTPLAATGKNMQLFPSLPPDRQDSADSKNTAVASEIYRSHFSRGASGESKDSFGKLGGNWTSNLSDMSYSAMRGLSYRQQFKLPETPSRFKAVDCSGWLVADTAHGIRNRSRGLLRSSFGGTYEPQYFAIVAFDQRNINSDEYHRDLVLVALMDDCKFKEFQSILVTSENAPNSYRLCLPDGRSALHHPILIGSLPLRLINEVHESISLTLPDTLFSAIEIKTQAKTYIFGATCEEDLLTWTSMLHKGMNRMRQEIASTRAQEKIMHDDLKSDPGTTRPNKWVEEVGWPRSFHFIWYLYSIFAPCWLLALIFLFNPYLDQCGGVQLDLVTGQCLDIYTANIEAQCQSWEMTKDVLGAWRSWIEVLQPYGLMGLDLKLEGDAQSCFKKSSWYKLLWYWLFFIVQGVEVLFMMAWTAINWRNVVRGARLLDEMEPKFHSKYWPTVDLLLCHYSEPAEDTIQTLTSMTQLDYPPSKLHIFICDDGYFKSNFSKVGKGEHWPCHTINEGNIKKSGDLRQMVRDFMLESDTDAGEQGTEPGAHPFLTTREVMPVLSSEARVVPRIDCAVGFLEDVYRVPGKPVVSFVARVKPKTHHAKAGNINNVLFNVGACGQYSAIFDNDMAPHPKFLTATLPLYFEQLPESSPKLQTSRSGKICWYSDAPDLNHLAYVQTPQYFKKNDLMMEQGDPLSHANKMFFDASMQGMDGYDSAMFVGTNCIWRREALDSIGGIQYGTISEDFWTGHNAHLLGWDSAYFRKDLQGTAEDRFRLSEGNVPDNVAASLAQRKRWHKGGVELFLGVKNEKDPDWKLPEARVPQRPVPRRVHRFRKFHWCLALVSWMNVFPAIFYPCLTITGLWSNTLWLCLNPLPAYIFMIPFLFLMNINSSLSSVNVSAEHALGGVREFFSYACVRTVGTFEAFYSKITGKPAAWGNTGGIGRGSIDEIPNLLIVIFLVCGLLRSSILFLFFPAGQSTIHDCIPIWSFTLLQLYLFGKMARVSVQEFFGWSYKSMNGSKVCWILIAPGIMFAAVTLGMREQGRFRQVLGLE